jgi:hypothetical protein
VRRSFQLIAYILADFVALAMLGLFMASEAAAASSASNDTDAKRNSKGIIQRPILNFTPGENFDPRGEFVPWG